MSLRKVISGSMRDMHYLPIILPPSHTSQTHATHCTHPLLEDINVARKSAIFYHMTTSINWGRWGGASGILQ